MWPGWLAHSGSVRFASSRGPGSAPALLLAVSQPCWRAFLIQAATVLRLSCSCRRDLRSSSVSAWDRVARVLGEEAEVGLGEVAVEGIASSRRGRVVALAA